MQIFVLLLILPAYAFSYKNPHYSTENGIKRTTMVHLFEWKFKDVANECENFLGPMGYGGVQLSPVHEYVIIPGRPWYERYQPVSYKIISRSGNISDFKDMVQRCNKVGVRIYVDAVINHMCADQRPAVGVGGSIAIPEERKYPAVPYGPEDFHQSCPIDNFGNEEVVRNCELVGLHDLDHRRENVRKVIVDAINELIDIGIAGIRVDAARHIWPNDLKIICDRLKNLNVEYGFAPNSRPYVFQEIIVHDGRYPGSRPEYSFASFIEFSFGKILGNMFRGRLDFRWLRNWGTEWHLPSEEGTLVMIDNHDNQRESASEDTILTYKTAKQYKMATAFMLAHPYGNPRIMSSYHFNTNNQGPPADSEGNIVSPVIENNICLNGWVCEHRWRQIYNMVRFRNIIGNSELKHWWYGEKDQIAFNRGDQGFVVFNGNHNDLRRRIYTGLPTGHYCDVISGSLENGKCTGKVIWVESDGNAEIHIPSYAEDGVLAIHVQAKL